MFSYVSVKFSRNCHRSDSAGVRSSLHGDQRQVGTERRAGVHRGGSVSSILSVSLVRRFNHDMFWEFKSTEYLPKGEYNKTPIFLSLGNIKK